MPLTKEDFRKIREGLGETQLQFAQRLGYKSYHSIHYKEKGIRLITRQDELLLSPLFKLLYPNKKAS